MARPGEDHPHAVLTEDLVVRARQLAHKGLCTPCIMKLLNYTGKRHTLYCAINYYTWKHVREWEHDTTD